MNCDCSAPAPKHFDEILGVDIWDVPANPGVGGLGILSFFVGSAGVSLLLVFSTSLVEGKILGVRLLRGTCWGRDAEFWSGYFRKLLLGFSDQQLISGLAIQISAYSTMCHTSGYHFGLAWLYAMMTSATHILTLFFLRDYMFEHPGLRNVKVTLMLANLVFWVVSAFTYNTELSNPIGCGMKFGFGPYFGSSFVTTAAIAQMLAVVVCVFTVLIGVCTVLRRWHSGIEKVLGGCAFWVALCLWIYAAYFTSIEKFKPISELVNIIGDEDTLSFGQVLPIMLFLLPIIKAGETFSDEKLAYEDSTVDIEATAGLPPDDDEDTTPAQEDREHSTPMICFPKPLRDAGSFASGFWRHRARRSVSLSTEVNVSNRKWAWAM